MHGALSSFTAPLNHALSADGIAHGAKNPMWELQRVQKIKSSWNDLLDIAREWKDAEGFDAERWTRVRFYDAEHEAQVLAFKAREEAAASGSADLVSEYRVHGQRHDGEYIVARDPERPSR